MTTIKAIETRYSGYRFRSRLEARWAIFFDVLGIKWEYEKEGFDLGPAGWYLPDFWLSHPLLPSPIWMEIKPNSLDDPGVFDTCETLSRMMPNDAVQLVVGNPWPNEYKTYVFYKGKRVGPKSFNLDKWGQVTVQKAFKSARSARFEHGESGYHG